MKQAGVMLIIKDGLVLGITRRYDKNIYGLPGGKFDPKVDRNPMDTAKRETLEECGIVVKSCVQVYQRVELGDGANKVDFYSTCYYATEWQGEPHSSEEGDVKWLTVGEITSSKAAFGEYNTKTMAVFHEMFPDVFLLQQEECCPRGCKTKYQMEIVHGNPQQFWEGLLEANTDGFITMEEARLGYEQYRRIYDAAPDK